jgi:CheY-like chemotaxis protein
MPLRDLPTREPGLSLVSGLAPCITEMTLPLESPPDQLRILVVEDHYDTSVVLGKYLQSMGHIVTAVPSAEEALVAWEDFDFDVLISDLVLPKMSGWDLMRELAEGGRAPAYAVAISGSVQPTDFQRSLEVGYRHHLLKPDITDELDAILTESLLEKAERSARESQLSD